MPEDAPDYGPRSEVLSLEEVARLCSGFARAGIKRVRLTGGEPLLRKGITSLVASLRATGLQVVLTTNGEHLGTHAAELFAAGLTGITVSLDSLDPQRFRSITRRGNLATVLAGIEQAQACGFTNTKLNVVALHGFNDDELGRMASFCWTRELMPRFIELMPMSGGACFAPGKLMSASAVRQSIGEAHGAQVVPDEGEGVRGYGPSTYWRLQGGRWHGRRFGTIAAMTENFCSSCNRLRVSATGQLHGCLARDDTGNLREALRSSDPNQLAAVVAAVLGTKRDAHGFNVDGTGGPNKAMISIGG